MRRWKDSAHLWRATEEEEEEKRRRRKKRAKADGRTTDMVSKRTKTAGGGWEGGSGKI